MRLARHTIVSICDSPNHTPECPNSSPQSQMCPKAALSWLLAKKEEKAGAVLRTVPIPARIPLWCPNGTVRYTSGIAPRNILPPRAQCAIAHVSAMASIGIDERRRSGMTRHNSGKVADAGSTLDHCWPRKLHYGVSASRVDLRPWFRLPFRMTA